MKKGILLAALSVILLLSGSFAALKIYHQKEYTASIEQVKADVNQRMQQQIGKDHYKKVSKKIGKTEIVAYLPTIKDETDHQNIEQEVLHAAKAERASSKNMAKDELIFYTFKKFENGRHTYSYTLHQETYAKKDHQLRKQKDRPIGKNLVMDADTGDLLRLSAVVQNRPDAATELRTAMQETLMASKKIPLDQLSVLEKVQYPTDLHTTNFRLTNDQLVIPVDVPGFPELQEAAVPLDHFAGYINEKFLPQNVAQTGSNPPATAKKIALTFDDGPNAKTTPQILAMLEKYHAKATFFVVGKEVQKNPGIVQKTLEAGHQIGNHSWNHPQLTKLSKEEVAQQILSTQMIVYEQTGHFPDSVRPPYGAVNKETAATIGLPIIQWSVDTEDWKIKNAAKITNSVLKHADDGAIVLMHDSHQFTADSLEQTLKKLQEQGYQFVTVNELLNGAPAIGHQYFSMTNEREVK
ncbi:polysaccharide deacetylase family protein [Listeria costaricensis]|uniref:polysaccharide deacetylase family protein n=1 Tax=Listeria costaricensis TaxID=2026604 RepID=UPI000C068CB4|nr:polysaccharide deacetylase family protein [Listeria costaricensis]